MFNPIIIAGPTGSGKTCLAAALAKLINGEIISADSRQVYKYLDIGTNKSGELDKDKKVRLFEGIPQHLTDLIEPSEFFSAGDFADSAKKVITSLEKSKKTPIICGGTGLYIKALVDGLAPLPKRNAQIRNELTHNLNEFGIEYLYELLKPIDPESAEKNKHNPQRLIRAIEVFRLTGAPISHWHKNTKPPKDKFLQFAIKWDKDELYQNIDKRSHNMMKSGMIEETKNVFDMGFSQDCPGLQSLGYRNVIKYLEGQMNLVKTEELLKLDTRHYAKRQLTWFRKDPRITWIRTNNSEFNPSRMAENIVKMLPNLIQ